MLIDEFYEGILMASQAMSIWEVLGVLLGLAYLALAMNQNILCWYAAFGSTAIFSWLFWDVNLFMESALNVYYLLMAVYGWWVWRGNAKSNRDAIMPIESPKLIQSWSISRHALVILGVILLSLITGYGLEKNTSAALPYLDSFTTWGAVVTTYMVAQKVLENWAYWLVIDTVAIYLYVDRELYLLSLQMLIYIVMIIMGWFMWSKEYRQQESAATNTVVA
ncbi:MAG: nicotinamide mononucleotide transporter [Oleispira sp.]|nr:nicotinamide mononucleotide transporter [Oleispira sp.]MBL4880110.1 nicotinamide mononucleotide transporter [Oleispira sp.]